MSALSNLQQPSSPSSFNPHIPSNPLQTSLDLQFLKKINLQSHLKFAPSSIFYIKQLNILCIGGYEGTLALLDSETFELLFKCPQFSQDPILDIQYYNKQGLLIVFSGTVRIAKILPNKQLTTLRTLGTNYFYNQFLGIDEENGLLITKTSDFSCNVYSLNRLISLKRFAPENVEEVFQNKSFCLYVPGKRLFVTLINQKLEAYNVPMGTKAWTEQTRLVSGSEIVALKYSKKENAIVGICENGEVMMWMISKKNKKIAEETMWKLNDVRCLGQSIGTSAGGQILIRDLNRVFCVNVQQKDSAVVGCKEAWPESVLFSDFGQEKVFALSWMTKSIQVIQVKETEVEGYSPKRAIKKIDNWLRSVWSKVVTPLVST